MNNGQELSSEEVAIRSHDIAVCLESNTVPDFEILPTLGSAVRLALQLRGAPAIEYDYLKRVAVYVIGIPGGVVKPAIELLAEAEFVRLRTEGRTIKTVIPDIPYYDDLFQKLTLVTDAANFNEPEQLALVLLAKLSDSPMLKDHVYQLGAERKLADRIIEIGNKASFIVGHRARGRDVLLAPSYFAETPGAYADLLAGHGGKRVGKVIRLLRDNPGWPLSKIESTSEIAGHSLDAEDVKVLRLLAGEGFVSPPAIVTKHAGTNYFLFGPMPGKTKIPIIKRPIYEASKALVAAVRQGQLLPVVYKIRNPVQLLSALLDRGYIGASSEAQHQYEQLVTLNVGKLQRVGPKARFVLINRPENREAVQVALQLVRGESPDLSQNDEVAIAFVKGEKYLDSLIGRKHLVSEAPVTPDDETKADIDSFLLKGWE